MTKESFGISSQVEELYCPNLGRVKDGLWMKKDKKNKNNLKVGQK